MKKFWISMFALVAVSVGSLSCTKKDETPTAPPATTTNSPAGAAGAPGAAATAPGAEATNPGVPVPGAINQAPEHGTVPGATAPTPGAAGTTTPPQK